MTSHRLSCSIVHAGKKLICIESNEDNGHASSGTFGGADVLETTFRPDFDLTIGMSTPLTQVRILESRRSTAFKFIRPYILMRVSS